MKKSILLFIFVSLFACSYAINPVVTVNDAKLTATNFMVEQCHVNAASLNLTLQYTETDENGEPLYYRFQVNNQGFVMVSASELYNPILAFSFESNFESSTESDAFCESYKQSIKDAKIANRPAKASVAEAWNHFKQAKFSPIKAGDDSNNECMPLLTTNWGQGAYYNQYCPYDGNNYSTTNNTKDARTMVGNAAVAMASILYYYRYPTQGQGGVSYISSIDRGAYMETYPRIFLDLNNVQYNYDAMPSSINSYNGEVAKLLFHTGASALTNYSAERSTNFKTITEPIQAYNALKNYWGISTNASMFFRPDEIQHQDNDNTNDSIWVAQYIIPELQARRPVFYSAYKDIAGTVNMCMVIDGYKYMTNAQGVSNVFLHVNLAPTTTSGEMKKAYYMYPSANFIYKFKESIIRGLQPNAENIEKAITGTTYLTAQTGSISDGAGNMKYLPNTSRNWILEAPNATSYTFNFKRLNTDENDVISIYEIESDGSLNFIESYSGQYRTIGCSDATQGSTQQVTFDYPALPEALTVEASAVMVAFVADDTIEDYGFVLEYTSTDDQSFVSTCAESQELTSYHYILIDKEMSADIDPEYVDLISSDDEPYAAHTQCSWTIKPAGAIGFDFHFKKFDLKAGDFIEVTTMGETPELLYIFDVFHYPQESYSVDVNKMRIRFVSDTWEEGNGFELDYWTRVGINQESGLSDINIYPNPAVNFLNIDLSSENAQNISVNICDMSGKIIYSDILNHEGGTQNFKVPVSQLASGIYFLHLNTATGKSIQKFVVR